MSMPRQNLRWIDLDQLSAGTNSKELAEYAAQQRRKRQLQSIALCTVVAFLVACFWYALWYVVRYAWRGGL